MLIIAEKFGRQHVIYMNGYSRFMLGFAQHTPLHLVLSDILDVRDFIKPHHRAGASGKTLHNVKLKPQSKPMVKIEFWVMCVTISDRIFFVLEQNKERLAMQEQDREEAHDKGKLLRMVMSQKNMNGRELSILTGVSEVTISKLRNGKVSNPQINTIITIAEALGVSVRDIWQPSEK